MHMKFIQSCVNLSFKITSQQPKMTGSIFSEFVHKRKDNGENIHVYTKVLGYMENQFLT